MDLQSRLRNMAKQLLTKTIDGKATWTPAKSAGEFPSMFRTNAAKLVITKMVPQTDNDYIELELFNLSQERQQSMVKLVAYDSHQRYGGGDDDYQLLSSLHSEAARVAYNWDTVFTSIESALTGYSAIDVPEEAGNGDIPF